MTLILGLTCPFHVFQVTDRLLTNVSKNKPFDPMANKNVIYRARDAVVSIGYTGLAYINRIPTDDWLAEKLGGILSVGNEPMGISLGADGAKNWLDIGQSVELLRSELSKALDPNLRQTFELIVVGWKVERKKRWVPFLWSIEYSGTSRELETNRSSRAWYNRNWRIVAAPESNFSLEQAKSVMAKIKQADSVDKIEEVLVNSIREVARKNSSVGPNCMSIYLPHPNLSRVVKASYCPVTQGQAVLYTDQWSRIVPAAYTPWLIGPSTSVRPSILVGMGWRCGIGSFEVQMDGPESPGGPEGFFGSQDRKKL